MASHQQGLLMVSPPTAVVVTWDPANKGSSTSLSNGNLTATMQDVAGVKATLSRNASENRYYEFTLTSAETFGPILGVGTSNATVGNGVGYPGVNAFGYGYWKFNGRKYNNGVETVYGATWALGDVIGVHLNAGVLTFYKNGVSQGIAFSGLSGDFFPHVGASSSNGTAGTANFGATAFPFGKPVGSTSWDGNQ